MRNLLAIFLLFFFSYGSWGAYQDSVRTIFQHLDSENVQTKNRVERAVKEALERETKNEGVSIHSARLRVEKLMANSHVLKKTINQLEEQLKQCRQQ